MPNVTLRLGFLGAGLIARYHAASLGQGGADATIATVYDPDRERADDFAARFGCRVVADAAAALDGVDAVYVCTWTAAHLELVGAAVERNLAVFCEKPLAVDLAGAAAMTALVQQRGVTHAVGLVLRSTLGFSLVKELVAEPLAGRLMSVNFRDDQLIPLGGYYGSTWRGDVAKAGAGTLLEHSIHDLDLLEWLCGPLAGVSALSANFHGNPGIEDDAAVLLRFRAGGLGTLSSIWHDLPGRLSNRRVEIFTEKCRIVAEGNAAEDVRWEYLSGGDTISATADAQADELRRRGVALPGNADVAFVDAATRRLPTQPDFAVALRAHRLADAVYRSAGGSVPGAAVEV